MLRPTVSQPVCLGAKPHLGLKTTFLLLWDSWGLLIWGAHSNEESVVYNCCWSSPIQSFWNPSPAKLMILLSQIRESPTWRARSPSLHVYPAGTGWPGYTPKHRALFRRVLRLARLRWRYSTPPPHGLLTLTDNGSSSSLYSLGKDRTENTTSSISSIVACVSVAAIMWRLLSHFLATGVFTTEPFLSNGCLWWPHNSGFQ
jgi:hypothetical protein